MDKNIWSYFSDFSLRRRFLFPFSSVPYGSKVLLYGAGGVGCDYYIQLLLTEYAKVVQWVDRDYENYSLLYEAPWKIESPDAASFQTCDYAVLAHSNARIAREMAAFLVGKGFSEERIIWLADADPLLFHPNRMTRLVKPVMMQYRSVCSKRGETIQQVIKRSTLELEREMMKGQLIIPRLVVVLGTRCSLRCRNCNNLMPMFQFPSFLPPEEIVKDINVFLCHVDQCISIELIGGEPLLYSGLEEVVSALIARSELEQIEITTNGTLLPSKELCRILSRGNVLLRISHYAASKQFDELLRLCEKYEIRHEALEELTWIDSGEPKAHGRSVDELRRIYATCGSSYFCKTLYDGKLYACARSASLYALGLCNDPNGFLDIRKNKNLREEMEKFFLKDMDIACDYCNVTDTWRQIKAGEQMQ